MLHGKVKYLATDILGWPICPISNSQAVRHKFSNELPTYTTQLLKTVKTSRLHLGVPVWNCQLSSASRPCSHLPCSHLQTYTHFKLLFIYYSTYFWLTGWCCLRTDTLYNKEEKHKHKVGSWLLQISRVNIYSFFFMVPQPPVGQNSSVSWIHNHTQTHHTR